jgi:small subunit ribosomal protein S4
MPAEQRQRIEKQLLDRLNRLGILAETAVLDDVLDLAIEDLLERRLQTMVFSKGMAKSVYQARQLITHGHIAIDGKRVPSPSYIVLRDDEAKLAYSPTSDLSKSDHPIRLSISAEGQTKPDMRAGARRGEGMEEKA